MTARYVDADGPYVSVAPTHGGDERRRADRVRSQVRATVRGCDGADGAPIKARAIDMCEHGAKLLLRRKFDVGSRVTIDLECELPLRVHLGFDADALVVDGPMHTHLVRLEAQVVRAERASNRLWDIGLSFCGETLPHERHVIYTYMEHLREDETYSV